ncbi:NUDIX domain-containing protein [Glycomyces luteolus]|uniref:NUDIX domain-containing protein n=1 Tax=Glycomyces luteolus TaxID=2670330 RepID=UPI0038CBF6BB
MSHVTIVDASSTPDRTSRARLSDLLQGIRPWDDLEQRHISTAQAWIASGAPLYRTVKPATPPMHLVSYFVVLDEARAQVMLVEHRKAGLWLPTGGHVEPGESPWETVQRECQEELDITAVPSAVFGEQPLFLTVTDTRGPGQHTDVSLWHLIRSTPETITWFSEEEFSSIKWLALTQVLDEPIEILDPHLHRFTAKLADAL